jgi:hypothetical protein
MPFPYNAVLMADDDDDDDDEVTTITQFVTIMIYSTKRA